MSANEPPNLERLTAAREADLVERAQQGDRAAMEAILHNYQRRVFSICYRMVGSPEDAADLTQDTLTKLLVNIGRYDQRAALSTWVYRIAVNACLSHRRKRRTVERHEAGESRLIASIDGRPPAEPAGGSEPSTADCVEQNEQKQAALASLRRIPDEARLLLILRDVRGLDYRQIADVLEVPVGTIKSRLFRARLVLRREMERATGEEEDPGVKSVVAPGKDPGNES